MTLITNRCSDALLSVSYQFGWHISQNRQYICRVPLRGIDTGYWTKDDKEMLPPILCSFCAASRH